MKILVFVKQVPDTDDVKLDPKTGNLKREGVQSMINPLDANAIEAAVQLKEKYGGTVAAISMGPPQAEDMLKKALALGCDEAYLLSDRAFGGAAECSPQDCGRKLPSRPERRCSLRG